MGAGGIFARLEPLAVPCLAGAPARCRSQVPRHSSGRLSDQAALDRRSKLGSAAWLEGCMARRAPG